jgi:peroxiredoxin
LILNFGFNSDKKMKLKLGQSAPNFEVLDIFGNSINLYELNNNKVLLTFFRYAECALCNLRVSELKSASDRFQALDIKLICIFQSNTEKLRKSIHERHNFNVIIIADPNRTLYNRYGVKPSWLKLLKTVSRKGISIMAKASAKGFSLGGQVDGKFHQIPADFLLDKNKRIEVVHYGNSLVDHISITDIVKPKIHLV